MSDYTVRIADRDIPISAADLDQLDIRYLGPEAGYHLIDGNRSYRCRVIDQPQRGKTLTVSVNGRRLEVRIEDELDKLIEQLGFRTLATAASGDARAPMPGLILEVTVAEGEDVSADQPLLVLEAMKMENVVKSSGEGTVRRIHVSQGEAVDKNQLLIEIA
jgi:biotin carboxyl carrier protein